MENNIIFGPINSRRFGVSLGIDLSPSHKQCNFDCLYCELAPSITTDKQTNVISVDKVIDELQKHLNPRIDVITLTANGEPTLYPYLNILIDKIDLIKNETKTLILTNSATLTDNSVFNSLLKLDQVKLSLDAVSENIFKKIDRPINSIKIDEITKKVYQFSKLYNGELFIEILFVDKINNTKEEIKKLNDFLLTIKTSRIDIGTIDRPPAYNVNSISYDELHDISKMFDNSLPIHIASRNNITTKKTNYNYEDIINTLDKRPLTREDINILFNEKSISRVEKLIDDLQITIKKVGNLEFYVPTTNLHRKKLSK